MIKKIKYSESPMFVASPGFGMSHLRTVDLAMADNSCVCAMIMYWSDCPHPPADPLA